MEVTWLLPDKDLKITLSCYIIQHLIVCFCRKTSKLQKNILQRNSKLKCS